MDMKTHWFKQLGPLYIPVHAYGYLVTILAIALVVPVSLAVVRNGQSVTDEIFQLFVYATCVAFWWKWIADKTSEK